MVNYQTSQYGLIKLLFYLSRLGVFQYVRDILQVIVSIDHPVTLSTARTPGASLLPGQWTWTASSLQWKKTFLEFGSEGMLLQAAHFLQVMREESVNIKTN